MRFAVLASGSDGNAMVIATARTAVLVDCGLSVRALHARLGELGLPPERIDAVLVTHEHHDHVSGVGAFSRRHRLPVYLTAGTLAAAALPLAHAPAAKVFSPHTPFAIGDLRVLPTPVPHDAREPCQFVFENAGRRVGILTDTGTTTAHIVRHFAGCNALVVEFNHDRARLQRSSYPAAVRRRIASDFGHLSNDQAREFLSQVDVSRLRHVVAAHVSRHNNTRECVVQTLAELGLAAGVEWAIAGADAVLPWQSVARGS